MEFPFHTTQCHVCLEFLIHIYSKKLLAFVCTFAIQRLIIAIKQQPKLMVKETDRPPSHFLCQMSKSEIEPWTFASDIFFLSISLSIYLSINLHVSIYLSIIYLSIYLLHVSIIYLSIYMYLSSIYLSVYLSSYMYLSIYLYMQHVCVSTCECLCLYVIRFT